MYVYVCINQSAFGLVGFAHQVAVEVGLQRHGGLQFGDLVVVVRVEPLGHVQRGRAVHTSRHGEHSTVAGRQVAVALRHGTEVLRPAHDSAR